VWGTGAEKDLKMLADHNQLTTMLETIHSLDAMSHIIAVNLAVQAVHVQLAGCDSAVGVDCWRSDGALMSGLSDHGRRMR